MARDARPSDSETPRDEAGGGQRLTGPPDFDIDTVSAILYHEIRPISGCSEPRVGLTSVSNGIDRQECSHDR